MHPDTTLQSAHSNVLKALGLTQDKAGASEANSQAPVSGSKLRPRKTGNAGDSGGSEHRHDGSSGEDGHDGEGEKVKGKHGRCMRSALAHSFTDPPHKRQGTGLVGMGGNGADAQQLQQECSDLDLLRSQTSVDNASMDDSVALRGVARLSEERSPKAGDDDKDDGDDDDDDGSGSADPSDPDALARKLHKRAANQSEFVESWVRSISNQVSGQQDSFKKQDSIKKHGAGTISKQGSGECISRTALGLRHWVMRLCHREVILNPSLLPCSISSAPGSKLAPNSH